MHLTLSIIPPNVESDEYTTDLVFSVLSCYSLVSISFDFPILMH